MTTRVPKTKTVTMGVGVANLIDESISAPTDGLVAVAQVFDELPQLHQKRPKRWLARFQTARIFRARIDWCGVGFDYVEDSDKLHIVGAWIDYSCDRHLRRIDCVLLLPADPDKYISTDDSLLSDL